MHATRWIMGLGISVAAAAHGAATTGENLLRNGSFEEIAGNGIFTEARFWKMGDPDQSGDYWGSASRENWRAIDGSFIGTVRGIWADRGNFGGMWQEAPAAAGATYRFSGHFYCDPEWMAERQVVRIEFWDTTRDQRIDSSEQEIIGCDMVWREITLEARAPENATWVRVVVDVDRTGPGGALQFDQLVLVAIDAHSESSSTGALP
jgi:hypothetical protein